MGISETVIWYDTATETQIPENSDTVSIFIYLHFSEADVGLLP